MQMIPDYLIWLQFFFLHFWIKDYVLISYKENNVI